MNAQFPFHIQVYDRATRQLILEMDCHVSRFEDIPGGGFGSGMVEFIGSPSTAHELRSNQFLVKATQSVETAYGIGEDIRITRDTSCYGYSVVTAQVSVWFLRRGSVAEETPEEVAAREARVAAAAAFTASRNALLEQVAQTVLAEGLVRKPAVGGSCLAFALEQIVTPNDETGPVILERWLEMQRLHDWPLRWGAVDSLGISLYWDEEK